MTGNRDDFTAETKRVVALRAAHRCSRCRKLTVRPHSDGARAVLTGVAAHICGASAHGPRFDAAQSPEERKALANAIWLCHVCSDLIDKDPLGFPADRLRAMKLGHEAWVVQEDFVPNLPAVSVHTYGGLVISLEARSTVTGELIEKCRDHEITIAASSRHELVQLKMRVQFPESVIGTTVLEQPVGLGVSIRRETPPWVANAAGGGSVTVRGPMGPSNCFTVEQERMFPARGLRFLVRTIQSERLRSAVGRDFLCDEDSWLTYAEGSFLYLDGGEYFERCFLVRLDQDETRAVSATQSQEPAGQSRLEVTGFGF
jgi:hypothetical protein